MMHNMHVALCISSQFYGVAALVHFVHRRVFQHSHSAPRAIVLRRSVGEYSFHSSFRTFRQMLARKWTVHHKRSQKLDFK